MYRIKPNNLAARYGFLATPHQAVTWGGPETPGSGRHCWGWTTPGSSSSSPSKNRMTAARSRMVAFGPLIRWFTRLVISAILAARMSLAGCASTR